MGKIKSVGRCKHCICLVGYDSDKVLVHTRHFGKYCDGRTPKPNSKIAELRK